MKRSRNILALSALLAVAAWTNVQVMTCCWFTESADKSTHTSSASASPSHEASAANESAGMAEDHSCCPGQASPTSEPSQTDSKSSHTCGAQMSGGAAICCTPETAPGELTVSNASFVPYSLTHLVLASWALFTTPDEIAMRTHPGGTDARIDAGSPRFLSLQRILI